MSSSSTGSPSRTPRAATSMPNLGTHNTTDAEGTVRDQPSSEIADDETQRRATPERRLTRTVTDAEGVQMIFPVRNTFHMNGDHATSIAEEGQEMRPVSPAIQTQERKRWHLKEVADMIIKLIRVASRFQGQLCAICDSLQISLKRFIIQDHSSDPTQQAYTSYLGRTKYTASKLFPRGAGSGKFRLGTFNDIKQRSERSKETNACPLCRLVVESLLVFHEHELETDKFANARCVASWQVDGREVVRDSEGNITESKPRTRRIQLSWDHPELEDSYLVLIAPEQRLQHEFDPQAPWSLNTLFLGRNISSAGNNQALAKLWLDTCSQHHGKVCQPEGGPRFDAMVSGAFFGAIDVHEMKLTALPQNQPYAALSYVWGQSKHLYKTLLSSIQVRQNPGELGKILSTLPPVIQDAIELVRGLGMKYLWIDSLCIVQDSNKSWKLNSAVMDLVFGNAHLTICAADGEDAFEGLRGISKNRVVSQQSQPVLKDVRLMVSHLAETYVQRSRWNTRAWTFQERLLAKRCLIFAGKRMFFQCRCAAMSEDIVAEQRSVGWSIELVRAPLQLLQSLTSKPFWLYMECVQLYTARDLTRSGDILAAFMGMSNLLSKHLGAPLIFGLPSSHFDLALLWEPKQKCVRRRSEDSHDDVDGDSGAQIQSEQDEGRRSANQSINSMSAFSKKPNRRHREQQSSYDESALPPEVIAKLKKLSELEARRQKDMRGSSFPSWSWCGWEGSTMEYRHETIVGCLEDVRQWHARHTWIKWHIRDSRGNLGLIWDKNTATAQEENAKLHGNWLGYYVPPNNNDSRFDEYGRALAPEMSQRTKNKFSRTLPEYPYKISISSATPGVEQAQHQLQFWTWSAYLRVNPHEQSEDVSLGQGLDRYDILDYTGDWCGTIVLDAPWEDAPGLEHEFIAISEAKSFSKNESDNWSYYIPHDRAQSDWSLYYVLLIKREKGIARRLGLGKVFKFAFEKSCLPGKEWREIILE